MCGIVGICSQEPVIDKSLLIKMRDAMSHRGPDDAGEWWSSDGRVGLGHRRLSIIDLSPTGHQPMTDHTKRYTITFNGEIYNYRGLRKELLQEGHIFHSNSDTEVILESYRRWGRSCLSHFDGAFAFAIYDKTTREVFFARDRAGEKPLFYKCSDKCFVFASELKALMADPAFSRELDLDALNYYFAYGYVSGPQTILKNTYKLSPGHAMMYSVETHSFNIWCYWYLPENRPLPTYFIEDLTDELETILSESICNQLVADVPVGILLSGGLDSSLTTALAARATSKSIKTYTITFPEHRLFDEGPYAKLIAEYFGTEHTELVAQPSSVSLLPRLARQYDEPIADYAIVPISMLSELVGKSVKVALGGDGGDELFGGYPHYSFLQTLDRLRSLIPGQIRKIISLTASYMLPIGTKYRNHLIGLEKGSENSAFAINNFFDASSRQKLLTPIYMDGYKNAILPEILKAEFFKNSLSIFQNAARLDFKTTMVDGYLVKSDRASMLYSLELRAPFLNHKIIEFAFGKVPDVLRATKTDRKILLKRLAKRLLPPQLDLNRKQGLTIPLDSWIKGEWGNFINDLLMESDSSIFDKKMIIKLMKLQRLGFSNANRLFALAMFELWRREYKINR